MHLGTSSPVSWELDFSASTMLCWMNVNHWIERKWIKLPTLTLCDIPHFCIKGKLMWCLIWTPRDAVKRHAMKAYTLFCNALYDKMEIRWPNRCFHCWVEDFKTHLESPSIMMFLIWYFLGSNENPFLNRGSFQEERVNTPSSLLVLALVELLIMKPIDLNWTKHSNHA